MSLKVYVFRSFQLKYDIINLKWIDSYRFLTIDPMEKVHLFDIERKDIIEASMSISEMELIYATADFKVLLFILTRILRIF